jgi:hypothetical protein
MTLSDEALSYWKTVLRYRNAASEVGRVHVANIEIPTLYLRSSNQRIQMHLSNIMSEEGIDHDEAQPINPSV